MEREGGRLMDGRRMGWGLMGMDAWMDRGCVFLRYWNGCR